MTDTVISAATVQNVVNVFTLINSLSVSVGKLPVRYAPPSYDHIPIWLAIAQDVCSVIRVGRTVHLHITNDSQHAEHDRHVRFVPNSGLMHCSK
jgi:hypothetical protein